MIRFYFIICSLIGHLGYSQQNESVIDTLIITDNDLHDSDKTQNIITISTLDMRKNSSNLSETLRSQTPLYIKENGRGMVSSPSFRGGTAQQTAFIWNGININSMFLGQGDINNLGLLSFNHIHIKTGGGSLLYGSGAIGGSVHLSNNLPFKAGFLGDYFIEYGSFSTLNSGVKTSYSDEKISLNLNASFSKSQNDYEVPDYQYKNLNGQYHHFHWGIDVGYRFSPHHRISIHSLISHGNQHYPIFTSTQNKTKYITNNHKNLIQWELKTSKITNNLLFSYLKEGYDYFTNADKPRSNGALGNIFILKNRFSYQPSPQWNIHFIPEYQYLNASGYNSGIKEPHRKVISGTLLVKNQFHEKIYIEGAIRKDFFSNTRSPWLFSMGMNTKFTPFYSLKINTSKNFRVPTFNDLYWEPGGNLHLLPETSLQTEMTHSFFFKHLNINLIAFYHKIDNMIQWLPTSQGHWSPFNTQKAKSYGGEFYLNYHQSFSFGAIKFSGIYAYTKSINEETQKANIYVPAHKITATASFLHRWLDFYLQNIYTGKVYTTTDESKTLPKSFISNIGINFHLKKHLTIGAKVNNLFNEAYQSSDYYPLPLRNFNINLNLKF